MTDEMIVYREILEVQNIALKVLREIRSYIRIGRTERQIAERCRELLAQYGVHESWYHDVPARVLAGERTALSVSGKDYRPAELAVQATDLVTIDLSPRLNGVWGDCARSFAVEDGEAVPYKNLPEWAETVKIQKYLHDQLELIARPEMTSEALYTEMHRKITTLGYENLDFTGSLGHSIETEPDERQYIAMGNRTPLSEYWFFSFAPHIGKTGEKRGFKMKNIYCFYNGALTAVGDEELLGLA